METDKKRLELWDCNQSQNILRDLMRRDFGLLYYNSCKTNTRNLEVAAEKKLTAKRYNELRYDLPGEPKATFLMAFSPDGTKMASAHGNHNVYISEVATGKNIKILSGHPRTPWCIAFHPFSNRILASGCLGGQVRVWDLSDGCTVWNVASETVIASLAFHPSGKSLVVATDNKIYFLDWQQSEPLAVISTKDENEKVRYVAFDASGRKLITGIGNLPEEKQSAKSRELDGLFLTKYRMRPSIDYLERATQNETRQSFRRTTTEPSCSSAPSNLRGSGAMRHLKNLTPQYTGNSRLRLGEGNGEPEFRNNMGLLSSIERVPAIVFNFLGITSYRVQAWDFSNQEIPDITNSEKNIVARKCKIHTDASIDISSDGKLLATCAVAAVGIYSLQWETLGQRIYWAETMHSVVSVSISPTQEHLLIGLSRDYSHERYIMACIYKLINKIEQSPVDESELYEYLRYKNMFYVRNLLQNNQLGDISINCIKWAPQPGQGLVYATNKGGLTILH